MITIMLSGLSLLLNAVSGVNIYIDSEKIQIVYSVFDEKGNG